MAGRFTPSRRLEQRVAQQIAAPAVTRAARDVAEGGKLAAPMDKVWITVADENVRKQHRDVHGAQVPENLRFALASPEYDMREYGVGRTQMARAPRDPALTPGLSENCRCTTATVVGIAQDITAHPATVSATQARAPVTVEHPLCETAEFGTDQDAGARYLAAGIRYAARKLNAR